VAVPQGARAEVVLLDYRTEVYQGVEVLPAPNIPFETDDSPLRYEKDMAVYGRDAYFPAAPVLVSEPMQMRGVDVVIMNVTPFQYNPVTKELVVYKDLRFRLDFVGGNGRFGDDRLRSRFWEPILQGHLLNYGSLPEVDFYAPERVNARDGWEYVIIVPDDPVFEAWADTIKAWRKLQGISCEVFTLTEVGGSTYNAIQTFLNNAYATWDPAPAAFLLLSDYPSSGDLYGITSPTYSYSYTCVSDNKYADVDGDSLPDMHHARITAQSETHLSTMINKFLSYERAPYTATNFYDEPIMACGWQTERWFQLAVEIVRGYFINVQSKNPVRQYNIYSGTPTVGGPWSSNANTYMIVAYFGAAGLGYIPDTNPYDASWWNNGSAAGINNAINSGAFLLQHRDHGSVTGWGEPSYGISNLSSLTNTQYVFVYSTNCLTGKYNYSTECFSERFHRINYGALGLNAASETSYSFVNDTYIWGMYDCLWPDFMPAYPVMGPQIPVGQMDIMPCMAMSSGKYFLAQSNWPYNPVNKDETYHLFHHHGDAFNVLYSEVPQNLSVAHAPVQPSGVATFTVSADDGSVIALTVNGEIIGVAEGTGSPQNIPIPPQVPGTTIKVTITKANYYRYEADVSVTTNTYPYVMVVSDIIDDQSGGNNDGIANPGETIDYGIWAKNVGSGTAQSVYGLLSVTDPYITINVDSSWYGNINENDSALSSPYYEFTIGSDCPDGYSISFDLDFHDTNDSVFTSHPSITVYAPLLVYQEYSITGGNGNSVLEPGETVDLAVTLENEGGAVASNVTSTLTTGSSWVVINDNSGSFGTIAVGGTASNGSDPYSVTADVGTPYGTEVEFAVIVEAGVYVDTLEFSLIVGQLVPTDTGHYYVYYSGGPHTYSPVFDWVAIDTTQTQYSGVSLNLSDDAVAQISLPFTFTYYGVNYNQVTISSNGWVAMGYVTSSYLTNYGIPSTSGPAAMIAGIWDDLDPGNSGQPSDIYWYYDDVNHRFIIEYFRVEHYSSGYHETFEIILYDPAYYPTPTGDGDVVVQYLVELQQADNTLGIENSSQNVGIQYYFDGVYHDLAVPVTDSFALRYTTFSPGYVGLEEAEELSVVPVRTMLGVVYPNPFVRDLRVSYQLAQRGRVSLAVYDALGRVVCGLVDGVEEPGYYTVNWQGFDDRGRKVPAGVYFVRLDTDNYQHVQKTVLLK